MGWQPDGSDDGGQYYYDLGLAVNPTDAHIIHVGGVNHWISFELQAFLFKITIYIYIYLLNCILFKIKIIGYL